METLKMNSPNPAPEKQSGSWKIYAAGGAFCALLATNGFLFWRSSQMETEMNRLQQSTSVEFNDMKENYRAQGERQQQTIAELNQQLTDTQAQAKQVATAAAQQVRANADRVARKAEELVRVLAEESKMQQARVTEEIGAVKEAHSATSARVGEVATEVGTVKTAVEKATSELESTIADLRSVRGDMGVQSGLIATNSRELAALRELGERNYHEFAIDKKMGRVKVAGILLQLKKADTKRNKFNLDLVADDKRVEKKDKTINEPVQFYMAGARQPWELVVNEVHKDKIVGYLATPKALQARR